jgi:hypothetical protein
MNFSRFQVVPLLAVAVMLAVVHPSVMAAFVIDSTGCNNAGNTLIRYTIPSLSPSLLSTAASKASHPYWGFKCF